MKADGVGRALLILGALLTGGSLAKGQTIPAQPPLIEMPAVEAASPVVAGGPKNLLDRPLSSAEATGAVRPLTLKNSVGRFAHIMPTHRLAAARAAAGLTYAAPAFANNMSYNGGQVVYPQVNIYNIFWGPPKLQSGAATGFSAGYLTIMNRVSAWMPSHGLFNILTQYYQTVAGPTQYIQNKGGLAGTYLDTGAYPASACIAKGTPRNCVSDAQLQAEIRRVMLLNGWTGGVGKIFLMFTSSGEDTCDSTGCSSADYCGYHSSFVLNGQPVIYGIEPYGNPNGCGNGKSPNNNPAADAAADTASHEIAEAVTNPFGDAWYNVASGNEVADLCTGYGTLTWKSATANQMWNGGYFVLQQEWSNHSGTCLSVGP